MREVIGGDVDPVVATNASLDRALVLDSSGTIPLSEECVHLIISDFTFEHIPDPSRTARELNRILIPRRLDLRTDGQTNICYIAWLPICHGDRKPLAHWFASQLRYARQEAEHLVSSDRTVLSRIDRVRLAAWPAPLAVVVYTLLIKGCLLDGWAGWFYALQRVLSQTLIALEIINERLRQDR